MQDTEFAKQSGLRSVRQQGGRRIKNRDKGSEPYAKLNVEIRLSNWERVRAIADARGRSIGDSLDEMIEADWQRRERSASRPSAA